MLIPQRSKRPILSTRGASGYAGLSPSKLEKLRVTGGGPRYIKIGRRVFYDPDDLDEWLTAQKRLSTSVALLDQGRMMPEWKAIEDNCDQTSEQAACNAEPRDRSVRCPAASLQKPGPGKLARSDQRPDTKGQPPTLRHAQTKRANHPSNQE
jgi:hypothetical protein